MLSPKERQAQKRLEARLQAEINAKKSKNCISAGYLPSQFGKVITNEQRLIDNGHYMKTSERAKLDYVREEYKKAKKASKPSEIVRVSKK